MIDISNETDAARRYAEAYATHYRSKKLSKAMSLYKEIMFNYSDSPEATFARSQIENIVEQVVPRQELLDA